MKKMLMMCAVVLAAVCAWAEPKPEGGPYYETIDGVTWAFMVDANLNAIVGGGGAGKPAIPTSTKGAISVPEKLGGRTVASIGDVAFYGCSALTEVTVATGVTSIGGLAFFNCTSITNITIPSSVIDIGMRAFYGCSNLPSVELPSDLRAISEGMFQNCSRLTHVAIPSSVSSIGGEAFCGCIRLKDIELPSGVTTISQGVFKNCSSLTNVTIPSSVASIGDEAFYCCASLENIELPSSVMSVGARAFYECHGLTSVELPSSLTSISEGMFLSCHGLSSIILPTSITNIGESAFADCTTLARVTIPASVASMGERVFSWCNNLDAIDFEGAPPSGVVNSEIKQDAVVRYNELYCAEWMPVITESGWTNATPYTPAKSEGGPYEEEFDGIEWTYMVDAELTAGVGCDSERTAVSSWTTGHVTIPLLLGGRSVERIEGFAFNGCSGLTGVTIPSIVTYVGEHAFDGCDSLESVDFEGAPPSGLKDAYIKTDVAIRYNAIYSDEWLPVITECGFTNATPYTPVEPKPEGGPYTEVVDGVEWTFMVDADLNASVGYDWRQPAVPRTTAGTLLIPAVLGRRIVTGVSDAAFYSCTNLTSVVLSSRVTTIGDSAFSYCNGLKSVSISSRVTRIGDCAFHMCSGLTSIEIPASVTHIGNSAFYGCDSLSWIELPWSVTKIGERAFNYCTRLNSILVDSANAYYSSIDGVLFNKDQTILVDFPDGRGGTYQIPSGVMSIGDYAFMHCDKLDSIEFPNEDWGSLWDIGYGAFELCTNLTRMTIPFSVSYIGGQAFSGCNNLNAIDFEGAPPPWDLKNACIKTDAAIRYNWAYQNEWLPVVEECGWTNAKPYTLPGGPYTETVDGIEWTFMVDEDLHAIVGADPHESRSAIPSSTVGDVVIPTVLGGRIVTDIGQLAFYDCRNLTSVAIPEDVVSIGDSAFSECESLSGITIPPGVTNIEVGAFCNCKGLTDVVIPSGVVNIKNLTFSGCAALANVSIPEGVTSVGYEAFSDCAALTSMTIPQTVTWVGSRAFVGCDSLNTLYFEGRPPTNLENAEIKKDAAIRYNVIYYDAWYRVRGFTNKKPYDPFAPVISEVVAQQRYPWNGKVDILFDVSSVRDEDRQLVVRAVERGSGVTNVASFVTGDVECTNGAHHIVWDMSEDGLGLVSSNVVFGVKYTLSVPGSALLPDAGGWSDDASVDLTSGARLAKKTEMLTCSSDWADDGETEAIAEIAVNGTVISSELGSGTAIWTPKRDGQYELTHTIKTNGVAVGDALTAEFIAEGINPKMPIVSPESGTTFDASLTVTMTCASEGATIHYTLDGSEPTMESPAYSKKFRIYERTVVKAIAFYADGLESKMAVAEYAPGRCDDPVISPPDGTVFEHSGQSVSIRRTAEDGVLRYTIDGSDPTEESPEYTGPFTIDEATVVKAKAFGDQYFDSNIVTAMLTRVWVKLATPVITADETFTGTKNKVVMSCANEGATIHYTLDGSEPTTSSLVYSKPFCVTEGCTIKAKAVQYDYTDSDVAEKEITREWGIGQTMGKPDHSFETSGDAGFVRVVDATAALGESMQSGEIKNSQTSILSTVVVGPGKLSFKWKTSCEDDPPLHEWDHAEFVLDGDILEMLDGETDWQSVSCDITGDGPHTVIWRYVKDGSEFEGEDCLWVSEYVWESDYTETQTTGVPVPYLWLEEKCSDVVDEFESYEKVAKQKALNKRLTVEQCYVAGVDPESLTQDFTTSISMEGGFPTVTWDPDLGVLREYKVWGRESLMSGDWVCPTNSTHHFFKVTVEMK